METPRGKFFDTLNRSNNNIKKDRAESIAEDSAIAFERNVQDLATSIRRKVRERENMLDLSPSNSMSLMVANEFDAVAFVERDNQLGLEIRELEIKHEIAEKRFKELFGGE